MNPLLMFCNFPLKINQKSFVAFNLFLIFVILLFVDCRNRRRNIPLEFKNSLVEFSVEGTSLERSVLFYYPDAAKGKIPLLLVFHGGGGTPEGMIGLDQGKLLDLAKEHKIAIAYMRGKNNSWNDLRDDPISEAHINQHEDVLYTSLFLDQITKKYSIDIKQVYGAGISNGGMMSLRLACEIPDRFVSITAFTASLPIKAKELCNPSQAIHLNIVNGSKDPIVPYEGGEVSLFRKSRGSILSTMESAELFANAYRCYSPQNYSIPKILLDDPTSLIVKEWICRQGSVQTITVQEGGHSWPGGIAYLPESIIGKTTKQMNASSLLIDLVQNKGKLKKELLKPSP
jgi:polyhydroxybutyrate depolymerase